MYVDACLCWSNSTFTFTHGHSHQEIYATTVYLGAWKLLSIKFSYNPSIGIHISMMLLVHFSTPMRMARMSLTSTSSSGSPSILTPLRRPPAVTSTLTSSPFSPGMESRMQLCTGLRELLSSLSVYSGVYWMVVKNTNFSKFWQSAPKLSF